MSPGMLGSMVQVAINNANSSNYIRKERRKMHDEKIDGIQKRLEAQEDSVWTFKPDERVTKLAMLILIHLYYEDDDSFSRKERNSVKSVVKDPKLYFSKEDQKEILTLAEEHVTKVTINNFVKKHDISDAMYNYAVKLVRDEVKMTKYENILDKLTY